MKKLSMLVVGLITTQLLFAQKDGYVSGQMPYVTKSCPNKKDTSSANFVFTKIALNAPANMIYGYLSTFTHTKVTKIEFTTGRATRILKCGNNKTSSTVMLQNTSGSFNIQPAQAGLGNPVNSTAVAGSPGKSQIIFSPGADLWTTSTNSTKLTINPNFASLPPIPAGCTETYDIAVVFKVYYANGCTASAIYIITIPRT